MSNTNLLTEDLLKHLEDFLDADTFSKVKHSTESFKKERRFEKILTGVEKLLSKASPAVPIKKTLDEEQRLALFVVLAPEEEDLQGDIYDAKEVEKACNNFNTYCNVANLLHKVETEKAIITQSFINLSDFLTEDSTLIKAGTWMQQLHFPEGDAESDQLWELVKSGELCGLSVGCKAQVEELEE